MRSTHSSDPNSHTYEPLLPPELECKIFELAFDPKDEARTSNLLSVAKRVRSWLRPLRYRVYIHRTSHQPGLNIDTRPSFVDIKEIASFIRCFVLDFDDLPTESSPGITSFLKLCVYLESLVVSPDNLSIDCMANILPALSTTRSLRRLSAQLGDMTETDLLSPTFQWLTHLELGYAQAEWSFSALRVLKKLTHVMVYGGDVVDAENIPILSTIPSFVENLKVFVFCTHFGGVLLDADIEFYAADDRRVIFESEMRTADGWPWSRASHEKPDIWFHAENVVTARQRKYFKSDEYLNRPISTPSDWHGDLTDEGKEWLYQSLGIRDTVNDDSYDLV